MGSSAPKLTVTSHIGAPQAPRPRVCLRLHKPRTWGCQPAEPRPRRQPSSQTAQTVEGRHAHRAPHRQSKKSSFTNLYIHAIPLRSMDPVEASNRTGSTYSNLRADWAEPGACDVRKKQARIAYLTASRLDCTGRKALVCWARRSMLVLAVWRYELKFRWLAIYDKSACRQQLA